MKTIKKITWRHIESLKWGLTFDYKSIAQNLWKTYDFDTIDRMRTFAMDKYKQLHKKYLAACLKKHDTVGACLAMIHSAMRFITLSGWVNRNTKK
jgi:hypothetical protein